LSFVGTTFLPLHRCRRVTASALRRQKGASDGHQRQTVGNTISDRITRFGGDSPGRSCSSTQASTLPSVSTGPASSPAAAPRPNWKTSSARRASRPVRSWAATGSLSMRARPRDPPLPLPAGRRGSADLPARGSLGTPRPILAVTVIGPTDSRLKEAILDSAADDSVFTEALAVQVGP
jgi:hypothetical protein